MHNRLCLNMIVRNETANLTRCLESVVLYIDTWAIMDTGSTDGTQQLITSFFERHGIPGKLGETPFINFAQARNAALTLAQETDSDYLLFLDADMELQIIDPDFRDGLTLDCYTVQQVLGNLSYWNRRLVRRDIPTQYVGVTHEYLDIQGRSQTRLSTISIHDHGTGSNRSNKFIRDLRLLRQALEEQPNNSRYRFYMAETLRYTGEYTQAIKHYAQRARMSEFPEEAWYARLQEARCLLQIKQYDKFIRSALAAYEVRPTRAEPLYDLAKYYRTINQYNIALIYALRGLALTQPIEDVLFVEADVYTCGLKEEISISGYYSSSQEIYRLGKEFCRELSTRLDIPKAVRAQAEANLRFYDDNTR